jgi:hypothetical protein
MLLISIQSDFLRFFIQNVEPDNWKETATSWVITTLVVAVLMAGLTFAYKALRKATAPHHDQKIWSRGKTWLSFFIGLFPVFLVLWGIWYLTRDYFNFIQFGGLVKGTLFAWILYLFFMIFGHIVSPWRRELF